MIHTRRLCLLSWSCLLLIAGCSSEPASTPPESSARADVSPLTVMVSIAPQRFFVERIGGNLVEAEVIAPPGYAPETYQVTPRQMDSFGKADLYFLIGMPFEEELVRRVSAVFPDLLIVDTREGVSMLSAAHEHHGEEETEHDHHHGGNDPHIWLDPQRVKIQARTMARALIERLPDHEMTFSQNLAAFEAELDALHSRLSEMLAPVSGGALYVFHPSFGYFADAYGLEQRSIEYEGKSPGARRLYAIMDEIKQAGVRVLFEQPQFTTSALSGIAAETGVEIVILDGLAEDYIENMKEMAAKIARHLQPPQPAGKDPS